MQVNNLSSQCTPMGSGMGPRNGTGPRAQQLKQNQQIQLQQNQQIEMQKQTQIDKQNQQEIAKQAAMATGIGANLNIVG